MKFSINKVILVLFVLGLIYILAPGPTKIADFSPLPNSLKSDEPGDTVQNPNVAAFFSDFDRAGITKFYYQNLANLFLLGKIIPPISLNHPPEYAKSVVRNELYVTFLEEYAYPLKGSLLVAGYEPFVDNNILKREHNFVGDHLHINGRYFVSKVTLRFYPSDLFDEIIVYFGIWLAIFALFEVYKRVFRESL